VAAPFGLLPASDPRLTKTAESILRANDALKGDSTVLARAAYDTTASNRTGSHSDQHDISSLATFWMVRYLIQLGRETGQARHWSRALVMLEGILSRLSQLGLMLRSPGRSMESARQVPNPGGTGWRLHAMLIDTILDFAGVDYDAIDHKLFVRPILPGQWPQTGIKQLFPCGDVSYRLERPIGGKVYHLNLKTQLKHPVDLEVELTCPDLKELGHWQAFPPTPEPALDSRTGQLRFRITLPSGASEANWTWG
jgi:glucoamylase